MTLFFPNLIEGYVILESYFPQLPNSQIIDIIVNYGSPTSGAANRVQFTNTFFFGSVVLIFGAFVRISCYYYLGKHFTFELSVHDDHKLVTSGPYSVVRHPSYSGNTLIVIGLLVPVLADY